MKPDEFQQTLDSAFSGLNFAGSGIALWAHEPWRQLLLANDWVHPGWAESAWSMHQKYVWYRTCFDRFAHYLEPPEIADVGPCLLKWGNSQALPALDDIANLAMPWALCLFEASKTTQTTFDGNVLTGRKFQVRYVARAQRLLVVAKDAQDSGYVLASVSSQAPGVHVEADTGLTGNADSGTVSFDDVGEVELLGRLPNEKTLRELRFQSVGFYLGRSGALSRQLEIAAAEIAHQDLDQDMDSRRAALTIEVLALQGLEQRAVSAQARTKPAPVPWSLLHAKGTELQLKIGELLVDVFGYYALPYPDEMTLHNEGVIGSKGSLQATQAMLLATEAINYGNLAGDLYDIAARDIGVAES